MHVRYKMNLCSLIVIKAGPRPRPPPRAPYQRKAPIFGVKIDIFKKKNLRYRKKKQFYNFPLLLRSPKVLSNVRDNTTLNTWVLQIE